jgi:hypothetical protein
MCHLDQLSHNVEVRAWHVDTEARPQEESITGEDQINLRINSRMGRQLYLLPSGSKLDRANEADRPSRSDELFRGWVRIRQLDIDLAITAAREPVFAAGGVSFASAKDLLSHD